MAQDYNLSYITLNSQAYLIPMYTNHGGNALMGSMYNGWGQFLYNSPDDAVIDTAKLDMQKQLTLLLGSNLSTDSNDYKFDTIALVNAATEGLGANREERNALNNASYHNAIYKLPALPMFAQGETYRWVGFYDNIFLSGSTIHNPGAPCFDDDAANVFTICEETTTEGNSTGGSSMQGGASGGTSSASALSAGISGASRLGVKKITKSRNEGPASGFSFYVINAGQSRTSGYSELFSDMMDLNGDGYADILLDNGRVQYTLPTGTLGSVTQPVNYGKAFASTYKGSGGNLTGTFMDMEKALANSGKGQAGFATASPSLGVSSMLMDDQVKYVFLDINGDGLPDKVYANGNVNINTGYGFAATENWGFTGIRNGSSESHSLSAGFNIASTSIAGGVNLSNNKSRTDIVFVDVNGDALPDIVRQYNNAIWVRLNNGSGFDNQVKWHTVTIPDNTVFNGMVNMALTYGFPIALFLPLKANTSAQVMAGKSFSKEKYQFMDLDGDGMADFLVSDHEDRMTVYASKMGRTNLLKKVTGPMRHEINITYKSSGHSTALPRRWLMDSVTVYDGYNENGCNHSLTTVEYENGYYDRREKSFYGFIKVRIKEHDTQQTQQPVYRITEQVYLNDNFYTKGLLAYEQLRANEAGVIYTQTANHYQLRNGRAADSYFPALIKTQSCFFQGTKYSPAGGITRTFEYDAYGNVIKHTDLGRQGDAPVVSDITYCTNTFRYMVGIPTAISVSSNNTLYRQRTITLNRLGKAKDIVHKMDNGNNHTYRLNYDQYGNLKEIQYPKVAGTDGMWLRYTYDTITYQYVLKTENAFNYVSYAQYNYLLGKPVKTTDINGAQMNYLYDGFGRLLTATGPYKGGFSPMAYTLRNTYYHTVNPAYAVTEHVDPDNVQGSPMLQTATFTDGLGRVVQTQKTAVVDGQDVVVVSGYVEFDAFSRTIVQDVPFTKASGTLGSFTNNRQSHKTSTAYDHMDRPMQITHADNSIEKYSYGFGDIGGKTQLSSSFTDANGNTTQSFTNTRGYQLGMLDAQGGWLTKDYNPIGEVVKVTDSEGNYTTYAYNLLGKALNINKYNANRGQQYLNTTFVYNQADQLVEKRENATCQQEGASSQIIQYEYERNRLKRIIYPGNPYRNVELTYGSDTTGVINGTGKVIVQSDETSLQFFEYDFLGNITKNVRTFTVPFNQEKTITLTTTFEYDLWGRIKQIVYPDDEILTYSYGRRGQLQKIFGQKEGYRYDYLNDVSYNLFAQKTFVEYGNGMKTHYTYNQQNQRLQKSIVENANGETIVRDYGYDAAGNITSIKGGGLNNYDFSHHYDYDRLNRLVQAQGEVNGLVVYVDHYDNYKLEMQYSPTGRITGKSQHHQAKFGSSPVETYGYTHYDFNEFDYSLCNPFTASSMMENGRQRSLQWDFKGNLIKCTSSRENFSAFYNEENRMTAYQDGSGRRTTYYAYDAQGERTLKINMNINSTDVNGYGNINVAEVNNMVLYVNPYFVGKSNGEYTKHYYMDDSRICSKLGSGKNPDLGSVLDYPKIHDRIIIQVYDKEEFLRSALMTHSKITGEGFNRQLDEVDGNGKGIPFQISKEIHFEDMLHVAVDINGNPLPYQPKKYEEIQHFYHSDQISSTNYITDRFQKFTQRVEYFPFGQLMFEERLNKMGVDYLFSAKELDAESGFNYFSQRYYHPKLSIFTTRDQLEENYLHITPYNFCNNNPLRYIDPDGRDWYENTLTGAVYYNSKMGENDAGKGAMTGEGWRHMGANGMFTQKDGITGSDQMLVLQNGGSMSADRNPLTGEITGSISMSMMLDDGTQAENFMSGQGYSKNPLVADVHVTDPARSFGEANGPVFFPDKTEIVEKVHSWTYAKKGAKGDYRVIDNYGDPKRSSKILNMTITEHRYERRQYDYSRSQRRMNNSFFNGLLKMGADIFGIMYGKK